jgi:hypothetical protein
MTQKKIGAVSQDFVNTVGVSSNGLDVPELPCGCQAGTWNPGLLPRNIHLGRVVNQ